MKRICKTCNKELELNTDNFQKNGDRYRTECKECRNISIKRKWEENYIKKKALINSLKTDCKKCGESKEYLIDFHHIDSEEKEYTIAEVAKLTWGLERTEKVITSEAKKCICLCSNCHREFHYLNRNYDIALDEYLNEYK